MKIALLTGASSGLGCAYAKYIGQIFPEIDEIWALARREGRLIEFARKVSKPKIVPVQCDLTKAEDIEKLKEKLTLKSRRSCCWSTTPDAATTANSPLPT